MTEPTEHQIIRGDDGSPLFALVPWDEYVKAFGKKPDAEVTLPHEVVGLHVIEGLSLVRAWREHLDLTQEEVARRIGITRPAMAQMERPDARLRFATLKKIASALDIDVEQLRSD